MIGRELADVCVQAAEGLLSYTGANGTNLSVAEAESYRTSGSEHLILTLARPLEDTSGMHIRIEDLFLTADAEFLFYDNDSRTLAAKVPEWVYNIASEEGHRFSVVTDLSFLVRNVMDYYQRYGEKIALPERAPSFSDDEVLYPSSPCPTEEQRKAVRTVLSSPVSYVWGAPGTGKTQEVLAAAVASYLLKGKRVAVIAPTNNAVEQVLRGLVSAIEADPRLSSAIDSDRDILRLGTATEPFSSEHPGMCEGRCIRAIAEKRRKDAGLLRSVLKERKRDSVRGDIAMLLAMWKKKDTGEDFDAVKERLEAALIDDPEISPLISEIGGENTKSVLESMQRICYGRDRPADSIE